MSSSLLGFASDCFALKALPRTIPIPMHWPAALANGKEHDFILLRIEILRSLECKKNPLALGARVGHPR